MKSPAYKTPFLFNWYANPYHTPFFVAKALGYYSQAGIHPAFLEPTDPSDVTEIIGTGTVGIGLKAMIHTVAARTKGYPVVSLGTLLDEPPTGLVALKSSGIKKFEDIVGRKVGYVGEFGKKIIDHLAKHAGIDPTSYTAVKVGMNVTDAIRRGIIDTGIGFINFQQVELEEIGETVLLRIDQLAGLGCCCFCSVQIIIHEKVLQNDPEKVRAFLQATQRGAAFTTECPDQAFDILCESKPQLRSELYKKIFIRTLPFFSRNLLNVDRDWNKVGKFCKHLGITHEGFDVPACYTNDYLPNAPFCEQAPIACCL